jgi:hypothetical protein
MIISENINTKQTVERDEKKGNNILFSWEMTSSSLYKRHLARLGTSEPDVTIRLTILLSHAVLSPVDIAPDACRTNSCAKKMM